MRTSLIVAASVALAACGGGGDGGGSSGSGNSSSASGFWAGGDWAVLVTPSGELWGYEQLAGGDLAAYKGEITTSGANFNGNVTAYLGTQSLTATVSGTFAPKSTLVGTMTAGARSAAFSATYGATYDASPDLAALAGNYTTDNGGTVQMSAAGKFTGLTSGCSYSGSLTPDASGKNFYRATLRYGAAPCLLPGVVATGVAVASVSGSSARIGVVGVVDSLKVGGVFIATR